MKKTHIISFLTLGLLIILSLNAICQPPGGRMTPEETVLREKQNMYKKITDLSEDQTVLIDGIYDEFAQSFDEIRKEARENRDREGMRTKMETLRSEKDELMKDVLSDSQWVIYEEMNAAQKKKMEERREQRGNRNDDGGRPEDNNDDQE